MEMVAFTWLLEVVVKRYGSPITNINGIKHIVRIWDPQSVLLKGSTVFIDFRGMEYNNRSTASDNRQQPTTHLQIAKRLRLAQAQPDQHLQKDKQPAINTSTDNADTYARGFQSRDTHRVPIVVIYHMHRLFANHILMDKKQ
ncbi:hypothetical protein Tco_1289517 [Tanacetum coccineum]